MDVAPAVVADEQTAAHRVERDPGRLAREAREVGAAQQLPAERGLEQVDVGPDADLVDLAVDEQQTVVFRVPGEPRAVGARRAPVERLDRLNELTGRQPRGRRCRCDGLDIDLEQVAMTAGIGVARIGQEQIE